MFTVLIYNQFDLGLKYIVVPGDYSRFKGVLINEYTQDEQKLELQDELHDFIYDDEGIYRELDIRAEFPVDAIIYSHNEGTIAHVIECGFLP